MKRARPFELGRLTARLDGIDPIHSGPSESDLKQLSQRLRNLAFRAECLYSAAWDDNLEWFLSNYHPLMDDVHTIECDVWNFKNRLAVISRSLEIRISRHGRSISSGHLALYEFVREPIYITWIASLYEDYFQPGDLRSPSTSDISDNWVHICSELDANRSWSSDSYTRYLDAELGSYEKLFPTSDIPLRKNQQDIIQTLRAIGRPLKSEELLAELDTRGLPSSSGTKQQFSFLVQLKKLVSTDDGYALPEWSDQS